MDLVVVASALRNLSLINASMVLGEPLNLDEKVACAIKELSGLEQKPVTRKRVTKKKVVRLEIPKGFKVTRVNDQYTTLANGTLTLRLYNNNKYPGHLARILVLSGKFGRYDKLVEQLNEQVGLVPDKNNLEEVYEWIKKVATHLNVNIEVYNTEKRELESVGVVENPEFNYQVYYEAGFFYYIVRV